MVSNARYIVGDTRDVLRTLPDASVDLVVTSPPFLALRSYLPADHPEKAKEIGSEATPGAFLDVLLDVVVELRRVLAPHGSLCVELGDTYAGSTSAGDSRAESDSGRVVIRDEENHGSRRIIIRSPVAVSTAGTGWPLAKSLCMVPSSFAFALAYGRNPWTGRELEPWRVRNIVRWCRPNPPVGALGDKFRPATSEMVVACTGGSRYFDLDAVRGEPSEWELRYAVDGYGHHGNHRPNADRADGGVSAGAKGYTPAGAPPLDYWVIPTHPYPGSHYATYPPELVVRPVKAMCPERVCRVCGRPSERIAEYTYDSTDPSAWGGRAGWATERPSADAQNATRDGVSERVNPSAQGMAHGRAAKIVSTLGWSDCGHNDWRRGIVLDPFAGSGTTLEVATGHGRDAIGVDLDPRNADLARQRVGMFLEVVEDGAAT